MENESLETSERGPNFFIVGAMKAGTTSICDYISQHPDIYMSPIKEPNYYVWENLRDPDALQVVGTRGLKSARSAQTIDTSQKYIALFSSANGYICRGEGSTAYLAHADAPERIHQHHPDAKVIAILRNPIERAYSAYTANKAAGLEPTGHFREAIMSELAGERDNWFYRWRYLHCGHYARQVARYIAKFGRTNVLLLNSDDLKENAARTCQRIFLHLGLRSDIKVRTTFIANRTSIPKGPVCRALMSSLVGENRLKAVLKRVLHPSTCYQLKSYAASALRPFGTRPEPISAGDQKFLVDYYKEDIIDLEHLTSWKLRSWRAETGH